MLYSTAKMLTGRADDYIRHMPCWPVVPHERWAAVKLAIDLKTTPNRARKALKTARLVVENTRRARAAIKMPEWRPVIPLDAPLDRPANYRAWFSEMPADIIAEVRARLSGRRSVRHASYFIVKHDTAVGGPMLEARIWFEPCGPVEDVLFPWERRVA